MSQSPSEDLPVCFRPRRPGPKLLPPNLSGVPGRDVGGVIALYDILDELTLLRLAVQNAAATLATTRRPRRRKRLEARS